VSAVKPCVLIPTYNHTAALEGIVAFLCRQGLPVIVIDDGNELGAARSIAAICAAHEGVELLRRDVNGGKGAAVLDGIARAEARGFTHALQIDADGQHDLARVTDLLALARAHPHALVTGEPVYDETVPRSRRIARWITHVWVAVNTLSFRIVDSMCGFRIYPVAETLAVVRAAHVAKRMAFDTEILVRLVWRGAEVVTLPVAVTYPAGNHSNFAMWDDNLRLSGMHAKLFFLMLARLPGLLFDRLSGRSPSSSHWAAIGERGSYAGLWLLGVVYKLFGRHVCLAVVSPVVLFFFLTGTDAAARLAQLSGSCSCRRSHRGEAWLASVLSAFPRLRFFGDRQTRGMDRKYSGVRSRRRRRGRIRQDQAQRQGRRGADGAFRQSGNPSRHRHARRALAGQRAGPHGSRRPVQSFDRGIFELLRRPCYPGDIRWTRYGNSPSAGGRKWRVGGNGGGQGAGHGERTHKLGAISRRACTFPARSAHSGRASQMPGASPLLSAARFRSSRLFRAVRGPDRAAAQRPGQGSYRLRRAICRPSGKSFAYRAATMVQFFRLLAPGGTSAAGAGRQARGTVEWMQ